MSNTQYENNKEAIIERNKQYYRANIDDKLQYNYDYYENINALQKKIVIQKGHQNDETRTATDRQKYQRLYYQNKTELCLASSF